MIRAPRLTLSLAEIVKKQFRTTLTRGAASADVETEGIVEKSEKSEEKTILVDKNGPITMIGINRPAKKNCLDYSTAQQLSEALDDFENDESSMVGILHGVGGSFSSGFDLDEIAKSSPDTEDGFPHFGPLCNRDGLIKKPLIGCITGYAVDVGFELALMCDWRVVEETASMGFLNRRLGVPIMCGGTVRLPAMIGYARAMDMIVTGRLINGDVASSWGLANLLVPCGAGLGRAVVMAQNITKLPQKPLLADRMSAHYATFSSQQMGEALQFEKDNSAHLLMEDGIAGAKRFVGGYGRHGKSRSNEPRDYGNFKKLSDEML